MLVYALLAYELHNVSDPLRLIQFRNELTARGWSSAHPSFTLTRVFAQDESERDMKLRADHGPAVDKDSFDRDAFCGVAADVNEVDALVQQQLVEAANATGAGTWCYVLHVGPEPPKGTRSVDLKIP